MFIEKYELLFQPMVKVGTIAGGDSQYQTVWLYPPQMRGHVVKPG